VIEIEKPFSKLAKERSIFHSEADFQHALAWTIQREFPEASVRLELPIQIKNKLLHVDIWIIHKGQIIGIELKYLVRKMTTQLNGELFQLNNQSAQDIRRYDFIKDIKRLEDIAEERKNFTGYAILLTNDTSYWSEPTNPDTIDAMFRLQEGRILKGKLSWGKKASEGTIKGREQSIVLKNRYEVRWQDYSQEGLFRSLTIQVGNR